MKPNIDIDRISLEDRIKALEGRFPVWGGSSFLFDFPTPQEWDQAASNGITHLSKGVLWKIDIDNTSNLPNRPQATARDFGIHLYFFIPLLNGILCAPSQVLIKIHKKTAAIQAGLSPLSNVDLDMNYLSALEPYFGAMNYYLLYYQNIHFWRFSSAGQYGLSNGTFRFSVSKPSNAYIGHPTLGVNSLAETPVAQVLFGCWFFPTPKPISGNMTISPYEYPIVGGNSHIGFGGTYERPDQLTSRLRTIYPPSWYA